MPEEEIVALMNRYAYDEYAYRIEAKPYVIETLKALKRGGGGRPSRADGKPVDEILFLDDNYNADKTAASAGMKVCGVFDDSSRDYADEIRSVSHHYIKDFCEIFAL